MKKGKLPAYKSNHLALRNVSVIQDSADTAKRSIQVVTATENPVLRYDEELGMVVNEVLLMDGIEMRQGSQQLPIVDSHDPSTFRNVIGSLRNLRVDGPTFGGDAYFASHERGQEAYEMLREGHLTDFSITADILEKRFIERGQTFTTKSGTVVEGPAVIVTRWKPLDASLVATGADPFATAIVRSYRDLNRKVVRQMDEALLGQLSAMGLPEGMTDPNQVLAWVVGKLSGAAPEAEEPEVMESMSAEVKTDEMVEKAADEATAPVEEEKPVVEMSATRAKEETLEQIKRALASDQKRRDEIQAACKLMKIERAYADELCNSFVSVSEARKRIIERMATQPLGSSVDADVRVTASEQDKFHNAVLDGLVMRSARSAGVKRSLFTNGDKPADGAQDFARLNLKRIAHACAERAGMPVSRMSDADISKAVMGNQNVLRQYRIERADFTPFHTTGSFSNLLLDAANKTLLAAYEEAPYTWNLWARQGSPAEDFKALNRIRFSEAPNPEEVPEGKDYPEKAMSDSRESYTVAKYGESFSVSWETVVNDDLDAISRIPAMHGNAMRRFQNAKVYEVLTSNPLMGDGIALFNSSHRNQSASAAAPSVTTLNAAFVAMMTQRGLSSEAIINVIPRYLIVPVALSATALELVSSTSYAVANGNQGINNIYGPTGSRPLTVVVDPQLDAASASIWYMSADPSQIDTVELTFLSGEESPVLESEWNLKNDTYLYKVRQTFGVKAIDWRGLFRNS